jgi:RNA polymerase sigma-70 factor, ECF subfamily
MRVAAPKTILDGWQLNSFHTMGDIMNSIADEVFSGRPGEFESVAARYSPVLFGVALRRLRNVEDAEDAVQDALLSAYKHFGQFEGRSQLSSWLTRIVINAAGMKLRGRCRREIVSLDQTAGDSGAALADELADAGPTPERVCEQMEMEEMLHRALARISPKLRAAFQMREIAGLSASEAADALKITKNTLKSRISRARAAVSEHLVGKVGAMHTQRANRSGRPRIERPARAARRLSAVI